MPTPSTCVLFLLPTIFNLAPVEDQHPGLPRAFPSEDPLGSLQGETKMGRLPKNIEEKARKADELIKKFQGQNKSEPPAVPPAVNTPPAPATPEPPANPPVDNPPVPAQPVPATVTTAPPAPAQEPVTPSPAPCAECAKWQQKFSVLQGKYDAEVPRYASRVFYLENQIVDLNGQINA